VSARAVAVRGETSDCILILAFEPQQGSNLCTVPQSTAGVRYTDNRSRPLASARSHFKTTCQLRSHSERSGAKRRISRYLRDVSFDEPNDTVSRSHKRNRRTAIASSRFDSAILHRPWRIQCADVDSANQALFTNL